GAARLSHRADTPAAGGQRQRPLDLAQSDPLDRIRPLRLVRWNQYAARLLSFLPVVRNQLRHRRAVYQPPVERAVAALDIVSPGDLRHRLPDADRRAAEYLGHLSHAGAYGRDPHGAGSLHSAHRLRLPGDRHRRVPLPVRDPDQAGDADYQADLGGGVSTGTPGTRRAALAPRAVRRSGVRHALSGGLALRGGAVALARCRPPD